MSIILDIIVIAIIALCVFLGYKKGLTGVLFKIVSFIVAIVLSLFLYKPLANFIKEKTIIDDIIANGIAQNITIKDDQETKEIQGEENLPDAISSYMNEILGKSVKDNLENAAQLVGDQIATIIIEIASLIIIYIVLKLVLLIIKIFTDAFANLPVIKQCDKIGGVAYGILESLAIIYIILAIISIATPMINNSELIDAINNTYVTKVMYNNNIILKIFF